MGKRVCIYQKSLDTQFNHVREKPGNKSIKMLSHFMGDFISSYGIFFFILKSPLSNRYYTI